MAFTQDFRSQRRNYDDGNTRIGELDRLWYDSITQTLRISDGVTPGGILVGLMSGTAELDFGSGNKTATVAVTGISKVLTASRVIATTRIEATADHPVDDLLVDPIRTSVMDLIAGVGFTIYGEMDNATANGRYKVDWFISN
tara:strand:+ start:677 stop:1102 length:426 start_codon:yes stop_codon:yes gene_type:complete